MLLQYIYFTKAHMHSRLMTQYRDEDSDFSCNINLNDSELILIDQILTYHQEMLREFLMKHGCHDIQEKSVLEDELENTINILSNVNEKQKSRGLITWKQYLSRRKAIEQQTDGKRSNG
jgi:hypothetical protein